MFLLKHIISTESNNNVQTGSDWRRLTESTLQTEPAAEKPRRNQNLRRFQPRFHLSISR